MMPLPFAASLRALARPGSAFHHPPPTLAKALGAMALVWTPLALLQALGTSWRALQAYGAMRGGTLPAWISARLGLDPGDVQGLLQTLPPPPAFGQVWPWLLLAVPLGVLGTWLHDAAWDHVGLWLAGGLKGKGGFRITLGAEAEALRITALGTLVGLMSFLPGLGLVLSLPLLLVDAYLWLFRGFALAARHGCERWRGLAATVVHAALFGCFLLGGLLLLVAMIRMGA